MQVFKYGFIIFCSLLIFQSCYKDEIITDEVEIIQIDHPENPGSGTVVGIISDEYGKSIQNATGSFPGLSFVSGEEGVLFYDLENEDQTGTILSMSVDQKSLKTSIPFLENEVNYFHRTIFRNPKMYSISGTEALFIEEKELNISVPPHRFTLNNEPYEDLVIVQSVIPDLSNATHLQGIPGNRIAIDDLGQKRWLQYEQVFSIAFQNEEQKTLHLSESGSVRFNNLLTGCKVWLFDESLGIWKLITDQDEFDGLVFYFNQGGMYAIAKDFPYNNVFGSVTYGAHPAVHQAVDIIHKDQLIDRIYTTNSGKWNCQLPVNEDFEIRVSPGCHDQKTIGFSTSTQETILEPLDLRLPDEGLIRIFGKTKDCSDQFIDRFFIFTENGPGSTVFFNDTNEVPLLLPRCHNEISLYTSNPILEEYSPVITYLPDIDSIILEPHFTCNSFREGYFKLNIDGNERIFTVMESRLKNGQTELLVYDEINLTSEFKISFSGSEARFYNDDELNILFDMVEINEKVYEIRCENSNSDCGFEHFKINHYGNEKGGWIQGNFFGEFWIKSLGPAEVSYKQISGEFLVPRSFS